LSVEHTDTRWRAFLRHRKTERAKMYSPSGIKTETGSLIALTRFGPCHLRVSELRLL